MFKVMLRLTNAGQECLQREFDVQEKAFQHDIKEFFNKAMHCYGPEACSYAWNATYVPMDIRVFIGSSLSFANEHDYRFELYNSEGQPVCLRGKLEV